MSEITIVNPWQDLLVGAAVVIVLLMLLVRLRYDPFAVPELDAYDAQFGEGPITVTPEQPSAWIEWDCRGELPPGTRLHSVVQVRYADGHTSGLRYAGAIYWGRYPRYPASGSHVAAYRIISN